MPNPTDAELCAMVAEELDPCPGGASYELGAEFDPLRSWEDFGRLWKWLESSGFIPYMDSQSCGILIGRERDFEILKPGDDPRRALVLAFLKARGRL